MKYIVCPLCQWQIPITVFWSKCPCWMSYPDVVKRCEKTWRKPVIVDDEEETKK